MNNSLRDSLKNGVAIRIKGPIEAVYIALDDSEIDQILALIESKMPLELPRGTSSNNWGNGFNECLKQVKSILRETTNG